MSWSLHIQVTDVNALDDLADLADRLIEANGDIPDGVTVSPITSPRWESDEHQMQLRAAIDAARALINVAGRPGDHVAGIQADCVLPWDPRYRGPGGIKS